MIKHLSDDARQERNDYQRYWRSANTDRVQEYNSRYWERRAEKRQRAQTIENASGVENEPKTLRE